MTFRLLSIILSAAFVFAANCARNKAIQAPNTPIIIDGLLNDWIDVPLFSGPKEPIASKISTDGEFLYVFIKFENRDYYRDAVKNGLSIYVDTDKKFRHQFGLTYPTGLVNELAQIPGARRAYIENPGWTYMPENQSLIQTIDKQMFDYVMITKRDNKDIPDRASRQSLVGLKALGIEVAADREGKNLAYEIKFPLKESRTQPYAPNTNNSTEFFVSIEINPPDLADIMQEPATGVLDPNMRGFDRVGRGAAGPNQRGVARGADQQLQDRIINAHMMGAYEFRKKVNLRIQ